MNEKISQFKAGLKDGIPIGLGYLAVSFTFGIMAKGAGLTTLEAVVLSFTNLTSAGQFAGLGIITAGSSLVEMAMAQLIINLRYCLMSCSLSQKLDSHMPFFHRFLMSYGVTDEIFGVSVCKSGVLSPYFSYGLMAMAVPGWTIGTLLGAVSGSLLPARLLSALNVALYGMFLAVVIPPARENKVLRMVILVSMALSFLFTQIPVLRDISSGFKIIILTFIVAGSAAVLFPVKDSKTNGDGDGCRRHLFRLRLKNQIEKQQGQQLHDFFTYGRDLDGGNGAIHAVLPHEEAADIGAEQAHGHTDGQEQRIAPNAPLHEK